MRTHGTLIKWNDERGFGFVALPQSHDEVFVHISAFPGEGGRPRLGETISFEVRTGPDGRRRAESVERPGVRKASSKQHAAPSRNQRTLIGSVSMIIVVLALCFAGYSSYTSRRSNEAMHLISPEAETASQKFSCDGRTLCHQMTSCTEAKYFLKHCPGTQMDGDGDGEPCEQQWCN